MVNENVHQLTVTDYKVLNPNDELTYAGDIFSEISAKITADKQKTLTYLIERADKILYESAQKYDENAKVFGVRYTTGFGEEENYIHATGIPVVIKKQIPESSIQEHLKRANLN